MEIEQIVKSLIFIRPGSQWVISGEDINNLEWTDTEQVQPTNKEIEEGWLKYQESIAAEAEAKATAKAQAEAKLVALGLTADDLKALGL